MSIQAVLDTAQKERQEIVVQSQYFRKLDLLNFWRKHPDAHRIETFFQGYEFSNNDSEYDPVMSITVYDKHGEEIEPDYQMNLDLNELDLPVLDDKYSRPKDVDRSLLKLAYKANWISDRKVVYAVMRHVDYYDDTYMNISYQTAIVEAYEDEATANRHSQAINRRVVPSKTFKSYREWDELSEGLQATFETLSARDKREFLEEYIPELFTWIEEITVL